MGNLVAALAISMLTIYFGTDSLGLRTEMLKKAGAVDGAALLRFDEVTITIPALQDSLGVTGLFDTTTVVVLDSVLENSHCKDEVLDLLEHFQKSRNHYFLLAGDVLAAERKKFEKCGAMLVEKDSLKKAAGFTNASFALADAVGRRDKKTAWVLYRKGVMQGTTPQEVCGTLIWQMRLIVLAHVSKSAGVAGVTDFPFKKAQSFTKYYSLSDAKHLLTYLLGVYHFDPEMNTGNTELALEKMILSL